jgi:transposase
MSQLQNWARKNTTPDDLVVLEASGNSFEVARCLKAIDRKALVLESCQMGKLKEAHANNDKISAVRIAKAYLAGTAKIVWLPDPKTQERRDWFHAQQKTVRRTTQVHNRLLSYLSDNGVRFTSPNLLSECPTTAQEQIQKSKPWTPRQWQVIQGILMEMRHAQEQHQHWTSLIAQEVLTDPQLLSLVRLCGVRDVVAFALGAIIGDINRFDNPKKLVKYVGLNPAFDDSGKNEWSGGIGGHGRKDLRALLIEAAHSIFRSPNHPLAKWGQKLMARTSCLNLAIAAVARKLTVAVWYLMKGRWTALEEIDAPLNRKLGKIISRVGPKGLEQLGKKRKEFRQEIFTLLKEPKIYVLDPNKTLRPIQHKKSVLPLCPG